MADTAKATPKKTAKPKKVATHPKYSEMVKAAISSLKERGGSSRAALLKYIMANFQVGSDAKVVNTHLKIALKNGVKNASLKQAKGTGASGSFKLGEKPKVEKKPKAKKAPKPKAAKPKKKPAAKKPKKAVGEKKTPVKKPKAKKPATAAAKKPAAAKPKKPAAKKSPKKTKPAAKPKKAKTPKKAAKK